MRLKTLCLAALILAVVCVTPASALEYIGSRKNFQ